MNSYDQLVSKIKALAKTVGGKEKQPVPAAVVMECLSLLDDLATRIDRYFPPNAEEKRAAKAHPISSQIVNFTTLDSQRKAIFNLKYFQDKFRALPPEKKLVAPRIPRVVAGLRDAIILYYYRLGKRLDHKQLKEFRAEVEKDYHDNPAVRKALQASELLRELLGKADQQEVVSALEKNFPKENDLQEFCKITKLKIPPQKRGRNVVRRTPHQRLAEKIHSQGAFARL